MKEVVYAVYRFQGGRWTRDRSFSSEQRDDAKLVAEALVTRQGVLGVTLVRETFVPETGATDEVGVWSKTNNAAVPTLGIAMRGRDDAAPAKGWAKAGRPKAEESPPARQTDDDEDDDVPALVSAGMRTATPYLVVFKLVTALVVAGFVAGGLSWVLASLNLYGMFTFVLPRQGIEAKVFAGLFVLALLVVLPNMVTWREFAAAFSVAPPGGPRRRTSPKAPVCKPAPVETYKPTRAQTAGAAGGGADVSAGSAAADGAAQQPTPPAVEPDSGP